MLWFEISGCKDKFVGLNANEKFKEIENCIDNVYDIPKYEQVKTITNRETLRCEIILKKMKKHLLFNNIEETNNSELGYWNDTKNVFFFNYKIKNAHIKSFFQYKGGWAKDKNSCYINGSRLTNGDPNSFVVLNNTYAKDKNNAWTLGGLIKDVDLNSFVVCDEGKKLHGYAKDKNNVYYYDFQGKTKIVRKADSSSFISLNDGYFGYDETSVFCGYRPISKVNPSNWKKLKNGYYYSRFENKIFYFNREIKNADADTFEVIDNQFSGRIYNQIARDKNNAYHNDNIISFERLEETIINFKKRTQKIKEKLG